MKKIPFLLVIILLIFPTQVTAQGNSIIVSGDTVEITFPNSIVFKVNLESESNISSVKIVLWHHTGYMWKGGRNWFSKDRDREKSISRVGVGYATERR